MGSVSGSRLVTQNLLLGLDSGWITGLWTVRTQGQGAEVSKPAVVWGRQRPRKGAGLGGRGSGEACFCHFFSLHCHLLLLSPPGSPRPWAFAQAVFSAWNALPNVTCELSSHLCSKRQ